MEKHYRQLLIDIKKISLSIKVLYTKLYELEINDLKESDEYKKILDYLNVALECEKNIYGRISDEEKDRMINHFWIIAICYLDNDSILDNLYSNDDEKLVNIRILSKLLENSPDKAISKISFDDQDFNSCLIKFINYFFKEKNSVDIILKYNLSFLVDGIEKLNIMSGFEDLIDVEVDDKTSLRKKFKVEDRLLIKEDNKLEYINRIKYTLKLLKSFSVADLNDNQRRIIYFFYLIYLRACIYFFSCYNDYDIIKSMIDSFIYNPEILKLNDTSLIIKSIRTTLLSVDTDKKYMDSNFYNLNEESKKKKN